MLKLAQPEFSDAAIADAVEVLRSGRLVQGEHVARFEAALGKFLGVRHVVAVSSGTAALHLAVLALGIGPDDEVIVPAFTYPATANAVEVAGARSVLVDIGIDDFCIDTAQLEAAWSPRVRAIIPVHEFGQSADMDGVIRFSERHGIDVIEDAACALGTEFCGRKAGTIGRLGCFSFHPRKAITTGEGGAIATVDDDLARELRALRNHGLDPDVTPQMDFIRAGLNYRMTELQAVLGFHQLQMLQEALATRHAQAARYDGLLASVSEVRPPARFASRRSVYQTYHVMLQDSVDRNQAIAMMKKAGIETNLGAHALNCLKYYRNKYHTSPADFPTATAAYQRGLALPIGSQCAMGEIDHVVDTLRKIISYTPA